MTTRARQVRLMKTLGFTLREEGRPMIWVHPISDVVVQISPDYCPSAAAVVDHAIARGAWHALARMDTRLNQTFSSAIRPFVRPIMLEPKSRARQ